MPQVDAGVPRRCPINATARRHFRWVASQATGPWRQGQTVGASAKRMSRAAITALTLARSWVAALFVAVLSIASVSSASAAICIPTVAFTCTTCKSYLDLKASAGNGAATVASVTTPAGFPTGYSACAHSTKVLVSSTIAPISAAFTYERVSVGADGAHWYTYEVYPVNTAIASDMGTVDFDMRLYAQGRVSGIPTIKVPATDKDGNTISGDADQNVIELAVNAMIPAAPGQTPSKLTISNILSWSFKPSLTVIYAGKAYTIYEGQEIEIQFADGSTALVTVDLSSFNFTTGIFRYKVNSWKKAPGNKATPPAVTNLSPVSISLPSFNPSALNLSGVPIIVDVRIYTGTVVAMPPTPVAPQVPAITAFDSTPLVNGGGLSYFGQHLLE